MIDRIKSWWANHVQKTMGYLTTVLIGMDLIGYAEPIKAFVGQKGYYAIVLAAGAVTAIRAHQVQTQPLPAPDPKASR